MTYYFLIFNVKILNDAEKVKWFISSFNGVTSVGSSKCAHIL